MGRGHTNSELAAIAHAEDVLRVLAPPAHVRRAQKSLAEQQLMLAALRAQAPITPDLATAPLPEPI